MWHLRILGGDKVVPSLRKVFFRENETVALPIHVLESAVEPYLAIQVRHLVSPKLIYQTVLYAWWLQRLKQYPCGVEYYVEMVLRPPQAVYDLVNSVENSIAIDGRLGELREEYLVRILQRAAEHREAHASHSPTQIVVEAGSRWLGPP